MYIYIYIHIRINSAKPYSGGRGYDSNYSRVNLSTNSRTSDRALRAPYTTWARTQSCEYLSSLSGLGLPAGTQKQAKRP